MWLEAACCGCELTGEEVVLASTRPEDAVGAEVEEEEEGEEEERRPPVHRAEDASPLSEEDTAEATRPARARAARRPGAGTTTTGTQSTAPRPRKKKKENLVASPLSDEDTAEVTRSERARAARRPGTVTTTTGVQCTAPRSRRKNLVAASPSDERCGLCFGFGWCRPQRERSVAYDLGFGFVLERK